MALTTLINTNLPLVSTLFPVADPTTVVVDGLIKSEFVGILREVVGGAYEPLTAEGITATLSNENNTIVITAPGNYKVTKLQTANTVTVGYTA